MLSELLCHLCEPSVWNGENGLLNSIAYPTEKDREIQRKNRDKQRSKGTN